MDETANHSLSTEDDQPSEFDTVKDMILNGYDEADKRGKDIRDYVALLADEGFLESRQTNSNLDKVASRLLETLNDAEASDEN